MMAVLENVRNLKLQTAGSYYQSLYDTRIMQHKTALPDSSPLFSVDVIKEGASLAPLILTFSAYSVVLLMYTWLPILYLQGTLPELPFAIWM